MFFFEGVATTGNEAFATANKRLNLIDRFNAAETGDILMGHVSLHLFHWGWLVQQAAPLNP
jgi:hypothetical protein